MPSAEPLNGDFDNLVDEVRVIPLPYNHDDSDASALKLVTALNPSWTEPGSKVEFVRFTEGITNTLMKAVNRREGLSKEEIDRDAILLRAYGYGTDKIIDRRRETQNHELLMKFGLAPELLARFNNGMMYRFISGKVTGPEDLRDPSIYLAVAHRLAQWHATVPCIPDAQPQSNGTNGASGSVPHLDVQHAAPGKPAPNLWTVMQKWILALPTETEAQRTRQAELQKELTSCIDELSQRPGLGKNGLVFAHCDLLSGNIIVEPPTGATNGVKTSDLSVNFIDYEYATPSPAAFDIANHFAEWGGFDCDYSAMPTRKQRREFMHAYIRSYFYHQPGSSSYDEEAEVRKLMEEVDIYRGLPALYWSIWALIQATISQIDFDYASYAELRMVEYLAWRDEMSGARVAQGREMTLRETRWAQEE